MHAAINGVKSTGHWRTVNGIPSPTTLHLLLSPLTYCTPLWKPPLLSSPRRRSDLEQRGDIYEMWHTTPISSVLYSYGAKWKQVQGCPIITYVAPIHQQTQVHIIRKLLATSVESIWVVGTWLLYPLIIDISAVTDRPVPSISTITKAYWPQLLTTQLGVVRMGELEILHRVQQVLPT